MTSAYSVESFASDLGEIRIDFVQEIGQNGKIFGKFTKLAIYLGSLPSSIRCMVRINIQ